ncbi:MAG UNVERIFIED_CONTAM: hypothetical protein LVR29_28110 [Microcystis novacekii LVE1205-3]
MGSEGTLGIATEITLRILKTPESICVLLPILPVSRRLAKRWRILLNRNDSGGDGDYG